MNNAKIQFIVIDENTLCYTIPEIPNTAGILRASTIRGSSYNDLTGSIAIPKRNVRLATRQDFDDYLIRNDQYDNDDRYEPLAKGSHK